MNNREDGKFLDYGDPFSEDDKNLPESEWLDDEYEEEAERAFALGVVIFTFVVLFAVFV